MRWFSILVALVCLSLPFEARAQADDYGELREQAKLADEDGPHYFFQQRAAYSVIGDRRDGQSIRTALGIKPNRYTQVTLGYDLLRQSTVVEERAVDDPVAALDVRLTSLGGPRVAIGGIFRPGVRWASHGHAYVETGWSWTSLLDVGLQYRFVAYAHDRYGHLVSASTTFSWENWLLDVRYGQGVSFVRDPRDRTREGPAGFDADSRRFQPSVLGRARHYFDERTYAEAGVGFGDPTDFVRLSGVVRGWMTQNYLALLGGGWEIIPGHNLTLEARYRVERDEPADEYAGRYSYTGLEGAVGYEFRTW